MNSEYTPTFKKIANRSTVIYGVANTGKSTIITEFLKILSGGIDQVVVFSPTDRSNHTYDCGLIARPLIHYDFTPDFIETIYKRQEAMTVTYNKVNNINVLNKLLNRLDGERSVDQVMLAKYRRQIKENNANLQKHISELSTTVTDYLTKVKEMETDCNQLNVLVIKKAIEDNLKFLNSKQLGADEQLTIKYLDFNHKLVMIFDDCTDILEKYKKSSVWTKLFTCGRHNHITIIVAAHNDQCTLPAIKKTAFNLIFTDQATASAYADRGSNNLSKEARQKMMQLISTTFVADKRYQKILIERESGKFYKYTASKHPSFTFGGALIWEYMERVQMQEGSIGENHPFAHDFT